MRAGLADIADTSAVDLTQLSYPDALLRFERDYLGALFARTAGNITEAARLAGLSRGHLHRKARQVGVDAEPFRGEVGQDGAERIDVGVDVGEDGDATGGGGCDG